MLAKSARPKETGRLRSSVARRFSGPEPGRHARPQTNIAAHSIYGPIIVNSNDEFIAKSILQTGAWALFEVSIVERIIEVILTRKNKVAFYDVGANFGCRCRIFPPEELSSLFDGRRSHLPSRRPGYWIPPGTRV